VQPNNLGLLAASLSLAEAAEKKAQAKALKAEAARDKILARHARLAAKKSALLAREASSELTREQYSMLSMLGAAFKALWRQRRVANAVRLSAYEAWTDCQMALAAARRAHQEALARANPEGNARPANGAVTLAVASRRFAKTT
jgi:hypothetical protein